MIKTFFHCLWQFFNLKMFTEDHRMMKVDGNWFCLCGKFQPKDPIKEPEIAGTTKYLCDYCGGWEEPTNKTHMEVSNVGLLMKITGSSLKPDFELRVCMWCWKKSFDLIFKKEKE